MTATILAGDAFEQLRTLPDFSVQMSVTSPPYYRLRDYGVSGQIGLEETPEQYIARLVDVFRELRRVLRDDGTLWLNIGDSYNGSGGAGGDYAKGGLKDGQPKYPGRNIDNLKPKDLIGIPWMLAFALRADGWYLRQDIIWHKPNPMPESVTDRCTKAHEYLFLLSKSARYYYDAAAISEPLLESSIKRNQTGWNGNENRDYISGPQNHMSKYLGSDAAKEATTRNRRSVWTIATSPYKGAHFATFPPALVEPCILAGSRPGDTVLDPFSGSGTAGAVALQIGRRYIGIELNPKYIELSRKRLQVNLGMGL